MQSIRSLLRHARLLVLAIFSILSTFLSSTSYAAEQVTPTKETAKSLNERSTAAAWEAFNTNKFEAAITNADVCIEEFRGAANRIQAKLEKEKKEIPNGAVTESQKKQIHENGLLNDVATCYFIKGRAAEKLKRNEEAKKAYEEAKKYSHARSWDPSGWFWSPAEAASDRLNSLRPH